MNKTAAVGAVLLIALGAFVTGRYTGKPGQRPERGGARRVLYYVDSMHPAYRSDKPGIAPDCGMPLEPVYEGDDPTAKLQLRVGAVAISQEKQQLVGVRVETVGRNAGSRSVRTTGRVEADETRVHRVMAGTEGWVQSLQNNPTGTIVKQNELLATVYSKEFRNAEQAYLSSLTSLERVKGVRDPSDPGRMNGTGDASLRINEEQLRALGMGEPQIKELGKTRQTTRDVAVSSPIDGIVLSRSIAPGQRFENGTEFYRIADLTKVWIIADIFADEAQWFRPGARVRVTVRERARTLYATVSNNPPLFDPASRTLKLRLEADNPGFQLRPDMFVDLEFNGRAPAALTVPQEAVLDSGRQKIVYVETADDVFEPRAVETGNAQGDRIIVLHGLEEGDRVVTSGNFLIDSESRIRSGKVVSNSSKNELASNRDPVCGMQLDAKHAHDGSHTAKYEGETFSFCSEKCQKKFEQDPAKYAGEKVGSAAIPAEGGEARR